MLSYIGADYTTSNQPVNILTQISQGEDLAAKTAQDIVNLVSKKPVVAQTPSWVPFVAIGGLLILLVVILSRKK